MRRCLFVAFLWMAACGSDPLVPSDSHPKASESNPPSPTEPFNPGNADPNNPDHPEGGTGETSQGAQGAANPDHIVFDATKRLHTVKGFGANIWPGDTASERVIRDLDLDFVRMAVNPEWPRVSPAPPLGATREQMNAYVEAHFGGDYATRPTFVKKTWDMVTSLGAEVILTQFDPPPIFYGHDWLGRTERKLDRARVGDWARLWGSLLTYLKNRTMVPYAIELTNEPDIQTNVEIPPDIYNSFVKATRAELDARGLNNVRIIGPGLSKIDNWGGGATWTRALDSTAVSSLSAWSIHAWDEPALGDGEVGLGYLRDRWRPWSQATGEKDPRRTKDIIVTEYGVVGNRFNGASFGKVSEGGQATASETPQYAVRAYENTLLYVHMGTSIPILWQAADQNWSAHTWGLLKRPSESSAPRPMFFALATLLPEIPDFASALTLVKYDATVTSTAFLKDHTLVVGLANSSAGSAERYIGFDNFSTMKLLRATSFSASGAKLVSIPFNVAGKKHQQLRVNLPRESTLTLVFDVTQ